MLAFRPRADTRCSHADKTRAQEGLPIEWPKGEVEPSRYWLSTLPQDSTLKQFVATAKVCWMIEQDYLRLKSELGLDQCFRDRPKRRLTASRAAGSPAGPSDATAQQYLLLVANQR
ncbi:MAG: hypothetical protein M3461_00470 [Pseudomonadota bacterium]|nr:hypothetical protein [Pseudomonadota bacterium]